MKEPGSMIYLSTPDVGEEERRLLLDAFDSGWIAPLGPHVDAFEAELAARVGRGHAVALSSGTAALHLALLTHGVRPGDEIVTSSLTFAATANAICYCGAKPVFIDSETRSWNLDPDLLEEELESRAKQGTLPRAVLVVDLYGQCADYDRIAPMCERHGVTLLEDAAEALGARYGSEPAGAFGAAAAFSFNGNKIITTSGGGMFVTDDAAVAQRARFLATQAREAAPHYQHETIGFNYRLSNLLAAVGRAQLASLDAKVERRRSIFARYQEAFRTVEGVLLMPEPSPSHSTRWLTCLTLDPAAGHDRESVRVSLLAEGIEARPVWKPMHLQPVFASAARRGGSVSQRLFETGLCLPSGSNLTNAQQDRVIEAFLKAIEQR